MPTFPIRDAIAATPRAYVVRLDLEGHAFPFKAGQAAYLQPEGVEKRRPYSMASAPEETARTGLLEFLVQVAPDGSSGLAPHLLRRGAPVAVDGPLGSFVFPDNPPERRFLFIAGGTGIAPLRSMLWHVLLSAGGGHIGLIYSVRAPDEFAYLDEFQRLHNEARIDFRHTVTRGTTEGWTGRQGRIDVDCLNGVVVPGETLCFLCGPPSLVGEIPPQLRDLGVLPEQIRVEQWR